MKEFLAIMAPQDDGGLDDEMIITLEFDDEGEVDCVVLGIFDVEDYPDDQFIAVAPMDESDDVYIYKYVELSDDDADEVEFTLEDIEDDDMFEIAVKEFDSLMEED